MTYDNATYLKDRYRLLREAGLCIDCKGESPTTARCATCLAHLRVSRRAKSRLLPRRDLWRAA